MSKQDSSFSLKITLPPEAERYACGLFLGLEEYLKKHHSDLWGGGMLDAEEMGNPDIVLSQSDHEFLTELGEKTAHDTRSFPGIELHPSPSGLLIMSGDTGGNAEVVAQILPRVLRHHKESQEFSFVWTTDTTGGAIRIGAKGFECLDLDEQLLGDRNLCRSAAS
jgi:hypothetical protein